MGKRTEDLEVLIRARYPIIYILTWEEERVQAEIAKLAEQRGKKVMLWSCSRGLAPYGADVQQTKGVEEKARDPLVALDSILHALEPAIYVMRDFHNFITEPGVCRRVRELAGHLKNSYKTMIILSPVLTLPVEIDKDVTVLEWGLPDQEDLDQLLTKVERELSAEKGMKLQLDGAAREKLLQAALGLTLGEAENALAKAIVLHGGLSEREVPLIIGEKEQIVRKSGVLEFVRPEAGMMEVGGLGALKDWLTKRGAAFARGAREFGLPVPRGILLFGVQGCGKSLTAKASARLWNMPLLRLDMGRVFSSLVGSSELNLRNAIQVAETVAPAVVWIDEIEKAFAGVQSSSFSDAGTTARVLASFLTWLQEKTAPVFVIATANEINILPPEFLRKGRLDELFFVDLPRREERKDIAVIHLAKRHRDPARFDVEAIADASEGRSGAEIEEAIVAGLFDAYSEGTDLTTEMVIDAMSRSVPLSQTMKEEIQGLRDWAATRARAASVPERAEVTPAGRKLEI